MRALGRRWRRIRARNRVGIVIAAGVLSLAAVLAAQAFMPGDRRVPIGALPLAPGARVVATHEEPPVDAATNDTFVRWLVVAGRAKESGPHFGARQRHELIRKGWRSITPPRTSGSYAALSEDGRYRLALLTTAQEANARPERLLIPSEIRRTLREGRVRQLSTRGRPILVAQIDRYVNSEVGAADATTPSSQPPPGEDLTAP